MELKILHFNALMRKIWKSIFNSNYGFFKFKNTSLYFFISRFLAWLIAKSKQTKTELRKLSNSFKLEIYISLSLTWIYRMLCECINVFRPYSIYLYFINSLVHLYTLQHIWVKVEISETRRCCPMTAKQFCFYHCIPQFILQAHIAL